MANPNIVNRIVDMNLLSIEEYNKFLYDIDIKTLSQIKQYLDDLYYNRGESNVNDDRYDMLKDALKERDSNYKEQVGAKIKEGRNRVRLPYHMGSMNKFKTADEIEKWKKNNITDDYIITEKLDGISCLYVYKDGKLKLYTRGDGTIGEDITHLAKHIPSIPEKLHEIDNLVVRGELIMSKDVFTKKYKGEYKNDRNMVAGLVNSKTLRKGVEDIDFIAYEVVEEGQQPKLSEQLSELDENYGFEEVNHDFLSRSEINLETLHDKLIEMKDNSAYEIDGIIVQTDKPYYRNVESNPEYAFAFKIMGEVIDTVVEEVEWNVSKWGVLKPRIRVRPIETGGVTITYATGFNAKYIVENSIGEGAVVKITRSGDVIPYIVEVAQGADEPSMPDVAYKWNANKVDILIDKSDCAMCIKLIVHFFTTLSIKQINEGTVKKMYDHGFVTLLSIIRASKADLLQVPGFKSKTVDNVYNNIHNGLQNILMSELMTASAIFGFGFGRRRSKTILDNIPDLITNYKNKTLEDIMKVEGFSNITAAKVLSGLDWFHKFTIALKDYVTYRVVKIISDVLKGEKVVFTGFRDAKLKEQVEQRGGKVTTTVSKNTTIVVAANKNDTSSKMSKAKELKLPIYSKDEFKNKYIN